MSDQYSYKGRHRAARAAKNWLVYLHIHTRIRKYMTEGAHCAPPPHQIGLSDIYDSENGNFDGDEKIISFSGGGFFAFS